MGFTQEEEAYVRQLQADVEAERVKSTQLQREYGQSSMFNQENTNLIQQQLNISEELERLDHILRGDIIQRDANGNEYWAKQTDPNLKPFNDHGVNTLMSVITSYVNKNTMLSNYDNELILTKMHDFSDEFADMIMLNHKAFGMDTQMKKNMFPMICRIVVDSVHSTYLRAFNGGERDSLRKQMHVTQNATPLNSQGQQMPMARQSFSLNPLRMLGFGR